MTPPWSQRIAVLAVALAPGHGDPFHLHRDQDEVVYVLSGRVEPRIDRERRSLEAGVQQAVTRINLLNS